MGAFSNLIAVAVIDEFGLVNIFYYQAALTLASLLVLLPLSIRKPLAVPASPNDDSSTSGNDGGSGRDRTGGIGPAPRGSLSRFFRLYCAMGTLGKLMGKFS